MKEVAVGMKFGSLEVIAPHQQGRHRKSWLCQCSCGKRLVLGSSNLISNGRYRTFKSCGCKEHAMNGILNNDSDKRLYGIWYEMRKRCYNPKADNYERYGGSGASVSDEWKDDFITFRKWSLANGYADDLTLDRIDSSKPYSPSNCRWADCYVQAQNRGVLKSSKTGVNGVTYNKKTNRYNACITRYKITKNLGSYKTLEEAAEARRKADEHFEEYNTIENL